jgi:ABC-type sugar transport system permease subunit
VISTGVSLPLSLFFSYYIAKKFKFAGFFRIVLFLPSILSSVVMVTLYQYFIDWVVPQIIEDITGKAGVMSFLNRGMTSQYLTIMFYNIWIGFGSGVLMYSNTMSAISPEIYDAASIDGAEGFNEFRFVSFPLIFSTFSVFFVTGITHIFTNQQSLYTFFGAHAPFQTFGYYVFTQTKEAAGNMTVYPKLACFGLLMSAVCIPLTFTVRWLLEKFGPSEE